MGVDVFEWMMMNEKIAYRSSYLFGWYPAVVLYQFLTSAETKTNADRSKIVVRGVWIIIRYIEVSYRLYKIDK